MKNDIEITPPGVARIAGPVKPVEAVAITDSAPKSLDEVRRRLTAFQEQSKAQYEILRQEEIETSRLAHPINVLIQEERLFLENNARSGILLEGLQRFIAEQRAEFHGYISSSETQTNVQNMKCIANIGNAVAAVAEINQWFSDRVAKLSDLHNRIKDCVADGRKHLAGLLPEHLAHLKPAQ